MERVWDDRQEPLRLIVGSPPERGMHVRPGDAAHRFSVRSREPLLICIDPFASLRPLVACLVTGRVVVGFVQEEDDLARAGARLFASAPGHVHRIPTAVYAGEAWSTHALHEIAHVYG